MFAVPHFVSADLVHRCGKEIVALNDHEVAARVRVLKHLRNFELEYERKLTELYYKLRTLYDNFKDPDRDAWTYVTSAQAARIIDPDSETVPLMTKYTVHGYLFSKYKHFVADHSQFLAKGLFWVRPQRELEDIETVERMVLQKDSHVDKFAEKAKIIVQRARSRERQEWRSPLSYEMDEHHHYNHEDITIIRFLHDSLIPRRAVQKDPYSVSTSTIIKKTGLYPGVDVDDGVVHHFLMELGVCPPWQDAVTRQPTLWWSTDPKGTVLEAVEDPIKLTSPSTQPLGPEDYYSHDIVDSLRHDFGDMPVYVIDDATAEELDDGISLERIPSEPETAWLHVHIADPTSVLPPGHVYSRRAAVLKQTLYFVERTISMLPHNKVLEKLSLGRAGGEPQCVMTFSAKVDVQGNILDYKVRPGIVNNVQIMTYDAVNDAMNTPNVANRYPFSGDDTETANPAAPLDKAVVDDLSYVQRLTRGLVNKRLQNGLLQFCLPTVDMSITPKPIPDVPSVLKTMQPYKWFGFPQVKYAVSDFRSHDTGSRQIVSECMKTACRVASMFFRDHDVPAIHRVAAGLTSTVPGGRERLLASRDPDGFVDYFQAMNEGIIYAAGTYDIKPGAHATLGIPEGEGYVRVTSPLRRFSDMLTHWQIKHLLLSPGGRRARMVSDEWLQDFARATGFKEHQDKRAEAVQSDYYAHQFIERRMFERQQGWRDGPDPLDSLVGIFTEALMKNSLKQEFQQPVVIPELGLKATLTGLDSDFSGAVGESVDIKIASIRLGMKPYMTVVRR